MPLTCTGRSSEALLGAMTGSCSWKIQVRRSIVATVTGVQCFGVGSLVLCQGLAGPWYARRECGAVGARVQ